MKKPPIFDRIESALTERKAAGLLRTTAACRADATIDCASNSYLNLHSSPAVTNKACALAGTDFAGNGASRLVATRSPLYAALESELAAWKRCPAALVYNSGYAANTGILQALANRSTEIFSDRLNHASIIDGIKLAGGRMVRYNHVDMNDLKQRLAQSSAREKIIVTDTVFSMDGDCAPLSDICQLAQEHGCLVMVDEAHATGVFGATGSGLVEELGVEAHVDVRMGTLSKAIAGMGGFFAGSELLRDFLVNHSRSLIYSTALPHAVIAWNLAAVQEIRNTPDKGRVLLENAAYFRRKLTAIGCDTLGSTTQIVPVLTETSAGATSLSQYLYAQGVRAPAIRPPTVPPNTARVRFSLHTGLTREDLDRIIDHVAAWRTTGKDAG
jgi:8-amino-7-oxononanoate synthase